MFRKSCILFLCLSAISYTADAQIFDILRIFTAGGGYLYGAISKANSVYDFLHPVQEFNETFAFLSLQNNLEKIGESISRLTKTIPDLTAINDRMFKLDVAVNKVFNYYEKCLAYKKPNNTFDHASILSFASGITSQYSGLDVAMEEIHTNMITSFSSPLVLLMEKNIDNLIPYCKTAVSRQQYFYQLYLSAICTEMMAMMIYDFSYNFTELSEGTNKISQRNYTLEKATERIKEINEVFRGVFRRVSRAIWRCDADKYEEDITYVKLNNLYRVILYQSNDIPKDHSCPLCPTSNKNTKLVAHCHSINQCRLQNQRVCKNIVQCTNSPEYRVCVNNNWVPERYEWVKYYEFKKEDLIPFIDAYGCNNKQYVFQSLGRTCTSCKCICDETTDSDRFFSLKPATSDITSNYVVTGIQFVKENHTIFMRIQQAKLLPNGFVSNNTQWKPIKNNTMADDYFITQRTFEANEIEPPEVVELNWFDRRGIFLDDNQLPENRVVTGAQIIDEKHGGESFLKLVLRSTEYNAKAGQLIPHTSTWHSINTPKSQRTELNLQGYDLSFNVDEDDKPINEKGNLNHYIYLTPSEITSKDVGQNTQPLIDIQEVVTSPAAALSSIKLTVKKSDRSGGCLLLMVETYDVLWLK